MPITDNIIDAWKLDEASGNFISKVAAHALVPTSVGYQAAGKVGYGALFNGSTSFAAIDNASSPNLNIPIGKNFSISFWFKTASPSNPFFEDMIFSKRNPLGVPVDSMFQASVYTGVLRTVFQKGANQVLIHGSTATVNDNVFHLGVITFIAGVAGGFRMYVDNVEDAGSGVSTSLIDEIVLTTPFRVGRSSYAASAFFNGVIDEMITWDRVITSTERAGLWNGGAGTNLWALAPAPSLATIVPVSGPVAGGTPVTIAGANFAAGARVFVA